MLSHLYTAGYWWLVLSKISAIILLLWTALDFMLGFAKNVMRSGGGFFYRLGYGILFFLPLPVALFLTGILMLIPPHFPH